MRDIANHRVELDRLRGELVLAWAETPFPIDKVALLNKRLKDILIKLGLGQDHYNRVVRTPEEELARREKSLAYHRDYYRRKKMERDFGGTNQV